METIKSVQLDSISYLTFKINEETYAINVANVKNIQELTRITEVPKSPDYFKGVIDLRGTVLPVLDPRIKLNLNVTENTINTCILVMEVGAENRTIQMGMLVDEVDEVIEITPNQIQPPPSKGNIQIVEILKGLYKQDDSEKFTMILDANKIFDVNESDTMVSSEIESTTN